jgi:hypothetical protein
MALNMALDYGNAKFANLAIPFFGQPLVPILSAYSLYPLSPDRNPVTLQGQNGKLDF